MVAKEASKEKSLVLLKPDGVLRGLIGEIISRFERTGLKLVAMRFVLPDEKIVADHYEDDPEWKINVGTKKNETLEKLGQEVTQTPTEIGDEVRELLLSGLRVAPVVAMVWEGHNAIKTIRKLVGATSPENAAPGTIRGDYSLDTYGLCDDSNRSMQNLVHASDAPETAAREIKIWFTDEQVHDYKRNDDWINYRVG